MNFKQGASLDMAGSGSGLIKGTLRSRMEQILLEDDSQANTTKSGLIQHKINGENDGENYVKKRWKKEDYQSKD